MDKFFLNQVFFKGGCYLIVRGVTGESFAGKGSNQDLLLEVRKSPGVSRTINPLWLAHSFVLTRATNYIAAWESQKFLIAKNFLKEGKTYMWVSVDEFSKEVFGSLEAIINDINRELSYEV